MVFLHNYLFILINSNNNLLSMYIIRPYDRFLDFLLRRIYLDSDVPYCRILGIFIAIPAGSKRKLKH